MTGEVEALRAQMAAMQSEIDRLEGRARATAAAQRRGRPRSPIVLDETAYSAGGPCFMCGVKRRDHDALGCKRWRERT